MRNSAAVVPKPVPPPGYGRAVFIATLRRPVFFAPLILGFLASLSMPIAFKLWAKAMQISPSGVLAMFGFAFGVIGFIAAIIGMFIHAKHLRAQRNLLPRFEIKPLPPFWHVALHMAIPSLILIPTASVLMLRDLVGSSRGGWAQFEKDAPGVAWQVMWGHHAED